ncbi:MAG TPA: hypothetical protein VE287_00020, partial [Actinopolymorphaceae bacterium]|nr:hypothetical protein [Actinopolymorphaceae bacterium]
MKLSVLRRGVRSAALMGVLVLSLAACGAGQTTTTETSSSPTASPHSTTTKHTKPAEPPESSSITLRRTGGIAGFNDVLVVDRDGRATFTSRARRRVTCAVDPKVNSQLDAAATAAAESPAPSRTSGKGRLKDRTAYPDELHLFLRVGDREVRFEDLGSDDSAYHRLFTLMNSVMAAA